MRVSRFEGSWIWLCVYLGVAIVPYAGVAHAQDWPNARYNDASDDEGGDSRRGDYDDSRRGDDRRRRDDGRGNDQRGGGYDDRRGGYDDSRRRDDRQSGSGYDDRRGGYDDSRRRDDRRGGGGGYDDRRSDDYDNDSYDQRGDSRRGRADDFDNGGSREDGDRGQSSSPESSGDKVFNGTGVAILGGLGSSSTLMLGINVKDLLLSFGFSFGYNVATAAAATTSSSGSSKVGFSLATSFAYMVYDSRPVAFGPEVDLDMRLAPSPAVTGFTQLRPGFALWYAPFNAPLYIGTMIGLTFTFVKGADPSISTEYGGFRVRWGF